MADVTTQAGANGSETIPALQQVRKVWIDQDLCTGDGLCTDIVPELFGLNDDGLAYVKDSDGELMVEPGRSGSLANIPAGNEELAVEAAQECPGECIFVTDVAGNTLPLSLFD